MVRLLIAAAGPSGLVLRDNDGMTALHCACAGATGRGAEVVEAILEAGPAAAAQPDAQAGACAAALS